MQIEVERSEPALRGCSLSGMTLDDVVSTSVFLQDLNHFAKMNGVYGTYFMDQLAPNSYRHRLKARRH